jgi:hypothetical protein
MRTTILAAVIGQAFLACRPCEVVDPWVVLGVRSGEAFHPLSTWEDPLPIEYGGQGGFHVDMSANVAGFPFKSGRDLVVWAEIDGQRIGYGTRMPYLRCDPDATMYEIPVARLFLNGWDPAPYLGVPIQVFAEFLGENETMAYDEAVITLRE